jgi:hypothetical protein
VVPQYGNLFAIVKVVHELLEHQPLPTLGLRNQSFVSCMAVSKSMNRRLACFVDFAVDAGPL